MNRIATTLIFASIFCFNQHDIKAMDKERFKEAMQRPYSRFNIVFPNVWDYFKQGKADLNDFNSQLSQDYKERANKAIQHISWDAFANFEQDPARRCEIRVLMRNPQKIIDRIRNPIREYFKKHATETRLPDTKLRELVDDAVMEIAIANISNIDLPNVAFKNPVYPSSSSSLFDPRKNVPAHEAPSDDKEVSDEQKNELIKRIIIGLIVVTDKAREKVQENVKLRSLAAAFGWSFESFHSLLEFTLKRNEPLLHHFLRLRSMAQLEIIARQI